MGNRGRHLTLILTTLVATLGCGGRSLLDEEGSAGANSSAGTPSNAAGAPNNVAGAPNNVAGATQTSGGSSASTCTYDEDCVVLPSSCCGTFEPVDSAQLIALSRALGETFQKTQCTGEYECPSSRTSTEYAETQKYFRAICFHPPNQPGQCQLLDVRGTPYTRCETSAECVLREGVACCPECDGQGWVPVNASISFCSVSTPCDDCSSLPAPNLAASCQAGTCRFAPPKR